MKTLSALLFLIIYFNFSVLSAEENPVTSWGKQIGFALEALSVTADNSGNCFIAGTTSDSLSSSYAGKKDAFLRKFDQSGNILWTINIGSDKDDYCYAIIADKDGNCILAGKTAGNLASQNLGKDDAFVVKINPSGKIIWEKQFGTPQTDDLAAIMIDSQGNYIVCGSTLGNFDGTSAGSYDAIAVKLSASGGIIWKKQYGTSVSEKAQYSALDKNNSSYFVLSTKEVLLYDSLGNFINKNNLSMSIIKGIVIDDSLNIYLGGSTGTSENSKAILAKYNKDLEKQWERTFGTGPWTGINCVRKFQDGTDEILVGVCQNYPSCMGVCRRYDHNGNAKWIYTLQKTGVSSICGHSVAIDGKGNCYLTGFTDGNLFDTKVKSQEMFLSRISFSGQTDVNYQNTVPGKFELNQNFPNPFNPTTTICYSLDKPSQVKLAVYDINGQEIKTLKNQFQNTGKYTIKWDATDEKNKAVCSGIYFCRLKTSYGVITNKMVFLK